MGILLDCRGLFFRMDVIPLSESEGIECAGHLEPGVTGTLVRPRRQSRRAVARERRKRARRETIAMVIAFLAVCGLAATFGYILQR